MRALSLQLVDHRVDFTKWWTSEFKAVKFPQGGTVFDYYIDPTSRRFESWANRVEEFTLDPDQPLQVRALWRVYARCLSDE